MPHWTPQSDNEPDTSKAKHFVKHVEVSLCLSWMNFVWFVCQKTCCCVFSLILKCPNFPPDFSRQLNQLTIRWLHSFGSLPRCRKMNSLNCHSPKIFCLTQFERFLRVSPLFWKVFWQALTSIEALLEVCASQKLEIDTCHDVVALKFRSSQLTSTEHVFLQRVETGIYHMFLSEHFWKVYVYYIFKKNMFNTFNTSNIDFKHVLNRL